MDVWSKRCEDQQLAGCREAGVQRVREVCDVVFWSSVKTIIFYRNPCFEPRELPQPIHSPNSESPMQRMLPRLDSFQACAASSGLQGGSCRRKVWDVHSTDIVHASTASASRLLVLRDAGLELRFGQCFGLDLWGALLPYP